MFRVISKPKLSDMEVVLFGPASIHSSEVGIRLYIYDHAVTNSEMSQKLNDEERSSGRECWDHKEILIENFNKRDIICANIELNNDWKEKKTPDGRRLFENTGQALGVLEGCILPVLLREWILSNTNANAQLEFVIDVHHIRHTEQQVDQIFQAMAGGQKEYRYICQSFQVHKNINGRIQEQTEK